jgi:ADP-heptose:LPS heptosyltransferase/predicted SAM-dependent methyltransferase
MTWSNDPATNRAFEQGESAKIRFELVPYTRGVGLELGCGPWRAFPHFIGIDVQAYRSELGPALVMDCSNLATFSDEAFDFVYSSHLLEHLEHTPAVLREWWRVIEVGGHLVLYLPHRELYPNIGEPGGNPDHKHDFRPEDIVATMRGVAPDWDLLECETRDQDDEYSFFQVFRKLAPGQGQLESWRTPRPPKRAAILRPGAYGDVLWTSSPIRHLKAQGYHVTLYTEARGEEVMRHNPDIDRFVVFGAQQIPRGFSSEYFAHEAKKYDLAVNLVESVERNALAWPTDTRFYWPDRVRRKVFAGNYLELIHDLVGVPYEFHQRFHASGAEMEQAKAWRREHCGEAGMVVIAPSGSTAPKFWPHVEAFAKHLAAGGVHAVILGDLREMEIAAGPFVHVVGMGWPIRHALALALCADAVVGEETAVLNAVAQEPMRKVALLSHSTSENLTKHWVNTVALSGAVPCYPCHRIHQTFDHCSRDESSGTAACQAEISAYDVLRALTAFSHAASGIRGLDPTRQI